MAHNFVLYSSVHTPLPLRLPAIPVSRGATQEDAERCFFDLCAAEAAFCDIVAPTFTKAIAALTQLAVRGVPLSISVSAGFLEMSKRWTPELTTAIGEMLRAPNVEPVAADPRDGCLFAFDISRFTETMAVARDELGELTGRPVRAAEVSGFAINHEVYHALGRLGIKTVFAEGAGRVNYGRHPAHLSRYGGGPLMARRLQWLSDELRHHLRAGLQDVHSMCETLAHMPGELAVISFPLVSLALGAGGPERGAEVLSRLADGCSHRGIRPLTISAATEKFATRAAEQAPPTLTAADRLPIEEAGGGGWTERVLFSRMQQAYHVGQLGGNYWGERIGDWLLQRVNLSLPRLAGDPDSRPPTYRHIDWWTSNPGYGDTAHQVITLYDNFIRSAALHAEKGVER
ncbi:MAG: hypothetical protein GTN69_08510 [Armatimonadetes bacterium]|nr:hypothetical protein [Gemmatimonadales bacterium]NIO75905.1 hypothetical protein [Armatimonadota bacterium]